jgi:DMSO reductase family type II enzyme chaperone
MITETEMTAAEARSKVYQLFALLFARPDEALWEALAGNQISRVLREAQDTLPFDSAIGETDFREFLEDLSFEDLGSLYTSKFEVGNAPVSLYERSYTNTSDAALFEELYRYYEYFGLSFDKGGMGDWPDALVVELEFMHYLSFLEAKRDGDCTGIRKAQTDFLERHLIHLAAGVADTLSKQHLVHYTALADTLQRFVAADLGFLDRHSGEPVSGARADALSASNTKSNDLRSNF